MFISRMTRNSDSKLSLTIEALDPNFIFFFPKLFKINIETKTLIWINSHKLLEKECIIFIVPFEILIVD